MEFHVPASYSPFSYLVSEHARAVNAIQDLQREVSSLLSFRDHVLEVLPHLHSRGTQETTPRPPPTSSSPSTKSLADAGPSTVVDSGFSTDKASTSMGKSSSSSGELSGSGGARWTNPDSDGSGCTSAPILETAEDELWQLLEVIQKKGTRLRRELEKVEKSERDFAYSSDPTHVAHPRPSSAGNPLPATQEPPFEVVGNPAVPLERWKDHADWWPHSLPGPGPRFEFFAGLEAWGEIERLKQDRLYLIGRLSRAEVEASSTHQRLLDLHSQLVSLAGEKMRVENAFRNWNCEQTYPVGVDSSFHGSKILLTGSKSGVTVNVKNEDSYLKSYKKSSAVKGDEEVVLPRVLKVPIKEKGDSSDRKKSSYTDILSKVSDGRSTTLLLPESGSDRVVIERERSASRVDGGLSMPASLLKGARIKVHPNKHRISAILKEKDVLSLQKQLLTTVMETEVLRRQIDIASDEWRGKLSEWEAENKHSLETQNFLKKENSALKEQVDALLRKKAIQKKDVGVSAAPVMKSASVATEAPDVEEPSATYTVHQGPNVKYDVVVYDDSSPGNRNPSSAPPPTRRPPAIEKPPRRSRPLSAGVLPPSSLISKKEIYFNSEASFGRDSLGRVAKIPLKSHSPRTPISNMTPSFTSRSSPASTVSITRAAVRIPAEAANMSSGRYVARRESLKVAVGGPSLGSLGYPTSNIISPPAKVDGKAPVGVPEGSSIQKATNSNSGAKSGNQKITRLPQPNGNGSIRRSLVGRATPKSGVDSPHSKEDLVYRNSSCETVDCPTRSNGYPYYPQGNWGRLYPWVSWINRKGVWPPSEKIPEKQGQGTNRPAQTLRNFNRKLSGALRIKSVGRPSVLPTNKGS